jgi:hypothetical protein
MWARHSNVLHQTVNMLTHKEEWALNQKVRCAYSDLRPSCLLAKGQHLLKIPIKKLLEKELVYKNAWILQGEATLNSVK